MNKLVLILAISCSCAYAQEVDKFTQHKNLTLEALDKREQILRDEKLCVENATTREELKSCFQEARKNRIDMDNSLRPKPLNTPSTPPLNPA